MNLTFAPADDGLWEQYDQLATRAYGYPIGDITHLREHADLRVAVRAGRVVAGGLGLLVDQFFGGATVPSACLGDGCVAPEERGDHLGAQMAAERLHPLIERGAVISTIVTSSTGYARRLGFEAPTGVFAWEVATDDLKRSFTGENFEVEHGLTDEAEALQRDLARQWNGPVCRPAWWTQWKQDKSNLITYPTLLHGLRHHRATADAWHPWMLRILDIPEAIRLRGSPTDLTTAVPMKIENQSGGWSQWMLQVKEGAAEIVPTHVGGAGGPHAAPARGLVRRRLLVHHLGPHGRSPRRIGEGARGPRPQHGTVRALAARPLLAGTGIQAPSGQDQQAGICGEMNPRAQPAAGPADGVVGRFSGRGPCLPAPAACW